jgi:putative hydrolase of the HAD superfamily
MPLPSVVMFDLDDTLVDHSTALRAGAYALANAAHVDTDPDEFAARWKAIHAEKYPRYLRGELGYEDMCRERIWEAINTSLSPEAADSLFVTYMNAYQATWRLFGDVLSCFVALSTYRLGVISNGRSAEQRKKLKVLGIEPRFEHVALSEETGVAKPDPKIFLGACAAMRVAPESAVFVGDSRELDYLAARAVGMSAVWLDRAAQAQAADTAVRVSSLDELPSLLAEQGHNLLLQRTGGSTVHRAESTVSARPPQRRSVQSQAVSGLPTR